MKVGKHPLRRGTAPVGNRDEGDFIFIGPGVPHQPVNMSATEPAYAIIARNDPNEQESVVAYDPASE